jgi:predicted Zn-dependent protease
MVQSVRKITPAEAAQIRPRIIDVVTVRPSDTVRSLAGQMAYREFRLERFLSLNGLTANSTLRPGQKVKLVVFGARRA